VINARLHAVVNPLRAATDRKDTRLRRIAEAVRQPRARIMSATSTNFSRGAPLRARPVGFLDAFPVAERHHIELARFGQRVRSGAPRLAGTFTYVCGDLFDDRDPSGRLVPIVPEGPRLAQPTQ
jgi:hypothetical protein